MNDREQIRAFAEDLDALVRRYCHEFELSAAGAIGVLALKQHEIMALAYRGDDEDATEDTET